MVVEAGAEVTEYVAGDRIYAMPLVVDNGVLRTVGFSNRYPGALCKEIIVEARHHIRLDEGVDPVLAAALDPVCTGIERARRTGAASSDVALVTGVGPVGLGAVIELAERGCREIIVSDPSAVRRELALVMGATDAVDPSDENPTQRAARCVADGDRLRVVEASGARGVLDDLLRTAPPFTVIAVVGASTIPAQVSTLAATTTNKTVVFASGPDFGEARHEALHRGYELLRSGRFDPSVMVTGCTGLAGAPALFEALRPTDGATELVKPLVVPSLDARELVTLEECGRRTR